MSAEKPPLEMLWNGPNRAPTTVVLAHGAGAAMDTPFMEFFAEGLSKQGLRVGRFEFPYMSARRESGRKRPPDREPVLREAWHEVIAAVKSKRLIIGGKSMGGRIASLIADERDVDGLLCLGYPFHPPGKPTQLRTEHLQDIRTPTLILQGTRDPFGKQEEVPGYGLSDQIRIKWLEDGDHNLKPRKVSGRTQAQNWREAVDAVAEFVAQLS